MAAGAAPSARFSHGFASAEGRLYVHGGQQYVVQNAINYTFAGEWAQGEAELGWDSD